MGWSREKGFALSAAFDALNNSEIDWMVLRNHRDLPEVNHSKDIDLGVSDKDSEKAEKIVASALRGFGYFYSYRVIYFSARCVIFFKTSIDDFDSIKIDFVDGVPFRGAKPFRFSDLYPNRIPYKGFYIPSELDDGVMLWMKTILMGGGVKREYAAEIMKQAQMHPMEFRAHLLRTFGRRIGEEVWGLFKEGRIDETALHTSRIRRATWIQALRTNPLDTLMSTLKFLNAEVRRRTSRGAFSWFGIVAGELAQVVAYRQELKIEVSRLFVKDVNDVLTRSGARDDFKYFGSADEFPEKGAEVTSGGGNELTAKFSRSIPFYAFIREWLNWQKTYWLYIRRQSVGGRIIVSEYSLFEFLPFVRCSGWWGARVLGTLMLRITPQPKFVFVIGSCGERTQTTYAGQPHHLIDRGEREGRKTSMDCFGCAIEVRPSTSARRSCRVALSEMLKLQADGG